MPHTLAGWLANHRKPAVSEGGDGLPFQRVEKALAYDRCYTASHLLQYHLLDGVRGDTERNAFLHDWISGRRPGDVPPAITGIIDRHARPTVVVDSFFHRLFTESKQTPFSATEIEQQLGAGTTTPS